jgi:hypothetical protein
MAKAKTASKNNPLSREAAKEFFYNGKKIVPVLYIGSGRSYMAAQFETGDMPSDKQGNPIPWSLVRS